MSAMGNIRVVMVETSHPGNLGAAVRAMKTMGLSRLYLVNATNHAVPEAYARAAGAEDLLHSATTCTNLAEAIHDCVWVVAASARHRHHEWPLQSPREGITELISKCHQTGDAPVAMVFGNEQSGLSNADLRACDSHVCIPTVADYRSLNLAAAVQVLCYECQLAYLAQDEQPQHVAKGGYITRAESERLLQHLEVVLRQINFVREQRPSQVLTRLRRLLTRARVEPMEYNILRGILTAIQKACVGD